MIQNKIPVHHAVTITGNRYRNTTYEVTVYPNKQEEFVYKVNGIVQPGKFIPLIDDGEDKVVVSHLST